MNGSVNLRTLTYKSQLKFGKYKDLTVYEVVSLLGGKGQIILIYYYFLFEKINFVDEILKDLGIPDKLKIKKPGKISKHSFDKIMWQIQDYRHDLFMAMDAEHRSKTISMSTKIYNLLEKNNYHNDNRNSVSSKSKLQSKNHGK